MSDIWIFREPRVGGTGFVELISNHLSRIPQFVGKDDLNLVHPISNSKSLVFNAHDFTNLKYVYLYEDPFIIRLYRKDKVEQILSHLVAAWYVASFPKDGRWNLRPDNMNQETIDNLGKLKPTIIPKAQVQDLFDTYTYSENTWKSYSSLYPSREICYEDICLGVDIPEIGVYNVKIDETSTTLKLPNLKRHVILNYDMVVKWIKDFYNID